jgi:putative ATP-dependent endonuclease of the OLD family
MMNLMRLLKLAAQNFRTLQGRLEIQFSPRYCTISGRNNAGKSALIRLLQVFFKHQDIGPWEEALEFDYKADKTQWVKETKPILLEYSLQLRSDEDTALIAFIQKIASLTITKPEIRIDVTYTVKESAQEITIDIDGIRVAESAVKEIVRRIRESRLLFIYNSTSRSDRYYYSGSGKRQAFYDLGLSTEETKSVQVASRHVDKQLKKVAKRHKEDLAALLGRLSETYEVEFSTPERWGSVHTPFSINLKDSQVEVPLGDWGSGTQNRTRVLMAILQANRIKVSAPADEKITPLVVIEEPESFLHPAAQSEFGKILRVLSSELGIQIIVTTHSPYLLNQEEPSANILLCRKMVRRRPHETELVNTTGDQWMAPFAEHLGVAPAEFGNWRPLFAAMQDRVLLVEGEIDQEYFTLLRDVDLGIERLSSNIQIVPYGGKDTLKNTLLLQFVLRKFSDVYFTFDLDAENEAKPALSRLGLKEKSDFIGLGLSAPGKDCVEGLLPPRIVSLVNGRETDKVFQLGSQDGGMRRKAKDALKKLYLAEFKSGAPYTKEELKYLAAAVKAINARFKSKKGANGDRK